MRSYDTKFASSGNSYVSFFQAQHTIEIFLSADPVPKPCNSIPLDFQELPMFVNLMFTYSVDTGK